MTLTLEICEIMLFDRLIKNVTNISLKCCFVWMVPSSEKKTQ